MLLRRLLRVVPRATGRQRSATPLQRFKIGQRPLHALVIELGDLLRVETESMIGESNDASDAKSWSSLLN